MVLPMRQDTGRRFLCSILIAIHLMEQTKKSEYFRNFIFGVEDSLVSTVGLLSGVASAGVGNKSVVLTGVVLVFVEAFSMAVGSLLSENSAAELTAKKAIPLKDSLGDALVMFASYLLTGLLVVAPYIFLSQRGAFITSIAVSLASLFVLGFASGYFTFTNKWRQGFVMSFLGGSAIVLGVAVGVLVERL